MALRWMDGVEHYGVLSGMTQGVGGGAAWSQVDPVVSGQGWSLSTANPATGDYHLRLVDGSNGERIIRRVFGVASQVAGFGYRFSVQTLPSNESNSGLVLAAFRDASNGEQCMIVMGTDGAVFALKGAAMANTVLGGTLIGERSDPCIAAGGYHHFEAKVKIGDTDGYIEVRINEVTVLNLTGVDTQSTANAVAAQVAVGMNGSVVSSSAGFGVFDLDDAFAWDDDASDPENTIVDFVGDKGAYFRPPNADTATSEFTVNASATAYGAIDEVPPSGVDYLDTALTAARTIVGVEALPGNVAEVIAWMPVIYAKKDDSGAMTMRGGLVSGTDESYGPDDNPSTAYAYLRPAPKTIDPATGAPWANDVVPDLLIERTA